MQVDRGRYLFTFAVISDSHINEQEDRSASPYACNRLANGRFRYVVHDLNRRATAFVVHLGDMGNPLPELSTYRQAADRFRSIAGELRAPLHLVPGNHCLGDKPGGWVPVPRVSEESLRQYAEVYGQGNYAFDHGPCHFVVLSSLLINSGLAAETDQRVWLEQDLADADAAGQRIWVMMHYPAFVGAPEEPGSYDNLDEPGRSWLLHLFEEHNVEAVYSGHVHHYFYNRYAGTDLYTVPATSFVRQDYSELFRVAPVDEEGGRNDTAKLGYCRVDVYEQGHHNRVVRTGGRVLNRSSALSSVPGDPGRLASIAVPKSITGGHPGIEMRENWLQRVALRTNNSVSPFTRRTARNDWAILALREMGISRVRVALQELIQDDVIERLATLEEAGFTFAVYSHGPPRESEYRLIREHRALLAGWELILRPDQVHGVARHVERVGLPCYLNEVRELTHAQLEDANVKHEANYGFQLSDGERLAEICARADVRAAFRGLVFRLRRRGRPQVTPWQAIQEISALGRASGLRHQVSVLFSGQLTAERLEDDLATARRVAESALAAWVARDVDVTFDTFEDVDRGYFVRHGLVDRRFNPRLAARVLCHLQAVLAGYDAQGVSPEPALRTDDAVFLTVRIAVGALVLVLPFREFSLRQIEISDVSGEVLRRIELSDGKASELPCVMAGSKLELVEPSRVEAPILLAVRSSG